MELLITDDNSMKNYISLLRGVNVTGHNKIRMEELKRLFENLGFQNIVTYIQSGNIVFKTKVDSIEKITGKIKNAINKDLGLDIDVIVKSLDEWKQIVDTKPFPDAEGNKSYVTFLLDLPKEIPLDAINKAKAPSEQFMISGKEIYIYCPDGYGRSKLSNNFFESKLKVSATSRNWNTIEYLYTLASKL